MQFFTVLLVFGVVAVCAVASARDLRSEQPRPLTGTDTEDVRPLEDESNSLATDGYDVYPGQFPYHARLFITAENISYTILSSGSLITPNYILTLADALMYGAGLVVEDAGGPVLVGITNLIYWCGTNYPIVYERVSELRDWIAANSDYFLTVFVAVGVVVVVGVASATGSDVPITHRAQDDSNPLATYGYTVFSGQVPHYAVLYVSNDAVSYTTISAGSLITPNYILTCARSLYNSVIMSNATYGYAILGLDDGSDKQRTVGAPIRYASNRILTNDECAEQHPSQTIGSQHICTTAYVGGSLCTRMLGSGLTVEDGKGPVLVGIATVIYMCELNYPTVFERVSYFRDWIAANSDYFSIAAVLIGVFVASVAGFDRQALHASPPSEPSTTEDANKLATQGYLVYPGQFPYHAGLFIRNDVDPGTTLAAGSLITPNYVLTAADILRSSISRANTTYGYALGGLWRYVRNEILTNGECGSLFSESSIDEQQICTNAYVGGSFCNRRHGSGLTVLDKSGPVLVGVISLFYQCTENYPTVFVRLSKVSDWIAANSDYVYDS
uniref:Uncharacterized protein n=1 Tax=Anopheles stephensi TaxID=30069 RepID=A0A182Y155_ANOST